MHTYTPPAEVTSKNKANFTRDIIEAALPGTVRRGVRNKGAFSLSALQAKFRVFAFWGKWASIQKNTDPIK